MRRLGFKWIFVVFGVFSLLLVTATGCNSDEVKPLLSKDALQEGDKTTKILVTNVEDTEQLKQEAEAKGVKASGSAVMVLEGTRETIAQLNIASQEQPVVMVDESIKVVKEPTAHEPDETSYFLAKKDFGVDRYLKEFPEHDGRNVKVGLVDDGVSPLHDGLKVTTTGERKYIGHSSNSTFLNIKMELSDKAKIASTDFISSFVTRYTRVWRGTVDESAHSGAVDLDLNGDGKATSKMEVGVFETASGLKVCIDFNNSKSINNDGECFGTFAESSEFGFWDKKILRAVMADFDINSSILKLSQGEVESDSHGEGVASVMSGHKIAGRFDGVAPGTKLLDYDLSESSHDFDETSYTMASFIKGFEWLGSQGAEVINVSYSLFFYSAASQEFMRVAIEKLIKKYNFIISFSAGNNGPGLGSYNRGLIYPSNSLVAAAFVGPELDEYVHGVTGLPSQGRVVWYSSRGPAPDSGSAPTVLSPLASLTHSTAQAGGFQAFSGTSSASPALAGFAAVLISAVKSKGLKVDPSAIVAAIKLSATPLEGAAFVEQGSGIPNIYKAVTIYQRLITGQDFASVTVLMKGNGPDNIPLKGLFLRTSQARNSYETRIMLRAKVADSVDATVTTANLLKTATIEYSHPWLKGPSKTAISKGGSNIYVRVDMQELLESKTLNIGGEALAEIRFIDEETGLCLHTIPVSIINDTPLTTKQTSIITLAPEEGKRLHFSLPYGVSKFKVTTEVLSGSASTLQMQIYDPSSAVIDSKGGVEGVLERYVSVDKTDGGWYHIGLAKYQGTEEPLEVKISVEPVKLSIASSALNSDNSVLRIFNDGSSMFDVKLLLNSTDEVEDSKIVTSKISEPITAQFDVKSPSICKFGIDPVNQYERANSLAYCMLKLYKEDGTLSWTKYSSGKSAFILYSDGYMSAECRPFEYTSMDNTQKETWKLNMTCLKLSIAHQEIAVRLRLKPGMNEIPLKSIVANKNYRVYLSPLLDDSSPVVVGDIKSY